MPHGVPTKGMAVPQRALCLNTHIEKTVDSPIISGNKKVYKVSSPKQSCNLLADQIWKDNEKFPLLGQFKKTRSRQRYDYHSKVIYSSVPKPSEEHWTKEHLADRYCSEQWFLTPSGWHCLMNLQEKKYMNLCWLVLVLFLPNL